MTILYNMFIVALAVYLAITQSSSWLWLLLLTSPAIALGLFILATLVAGAAVVTVFVIELLEDKKDKK